MRTKIFSLLVVLIFSPYFLLGQEKLGLDWKCSYYDDYSDSSAYTFASDNEAENAVLQILKYSGLVKNFIVRAANVPNAMATIQGQARYILYNQEFMLKVADVTHNDWAAKSIIAHEIGHHLQGHTITSAGSRPDLELQADIYSGFILQKMGATLTQAQAAMVAFGSEQGSATHPAKSARLAAIANGWIQARDLKTPEPKAPDKDPIPQDSIRGRKEGTSPQHPQPVVYTARCVFNGDLNSYFIDSQENIVAVNAYNQSVIIGKKTPPTYPNFIWMYTTQYVTYGVDSYGNIWSRYPNGVPFQVGYVTRP